MTQDLIKKGSLLGGILLVAGCCIGAGMLGLPVLSAMAGFKPSVVMFLICWLFMVCTGLLLLEVNLWFGEEISIITMAERTLGKGGKAVSWLVFLFLFYSLMVAYVAASGSLVSDFLNQWTGYSLHHGIGGALFCLLFGLLIYLGIGAVDWFNRLLMFGLIISYVCLVGLGLPHVDVSLLKHQDWEAATLVLPAVIVSFGFHNLVPSLTTYFKSHVGSLVKAIVIGSAIPLSVYLIWEWLILGLVPLGSFQEALDQGEIATEALKNAVGISWILDIAQAFAFFAIVTSFLSVAVSFVDFLSDGLGIQKTPRGKVLLASLVLGPPLLCALLYPTIFLQALNYAGGFGAVILFGILPALMVWKGRYTQKMGKRQLVPGGKPVLIAVFLFAFWVMALQLI
ncbi:amino acid permease [Candidatus Protochlamydia phocaeensis]|uniref:amino acid permease n=1 Tax=Candidatus Protochlamydia phocaeensis TaxID=1414722 RepID=UPI000837F6DC|nr:aromatic amino acid transport family protein [Candidatus Protochlamydia phocaeensis]